MHYINAIFTTAPGNTWSNADILPHYHQAIDRLSLSPPEKDTLRKSVTYFLVGKRTRQTAPNWLTLTTFNDHANAFETSAETSLTTLAKQILPTAKNANIVFDAIITTTSTGNLMPGLSYRLAQKLKSLVKPDSTLLDLGNVGCTGSLKALHLATHLNKSFNNTLVVSVEAPTTLVNWFATEVDIWQGNCTFGDGAAALWISSNPNNGPTALAIENLQYTQQSETGLNLIRWGHSTYYTFRLADEKTFNNDVRTHVFNALQNIDPAHLQNPHWAIHPAGITLLMRLSRKLGLSREALKPSIAHYEKYSNMSSASIVHILSDIATEAPPNTFINLLTMGAGFNVIYGRVRKDR